MIVFGTTLLPHLFVVLCIASWAKRRRNTKSGQDPVEEHKNPWTARTFPEYLKLKAAAEGKYVKLEDIV